MKCTLLTAAAVLAMGVAPAMAEDGRVPQSTLSAVGLGGMQVVSDAEGMQVRGMSSSSASSGRSLAFGQLVDQTGNVVVVSDTNAYRSTAENAGLNAGSLTGGTSNSNVAAALITAPPGFAGALQGGSGGFTLTGGI